MADADPCFLVGDIGGTNSRLQLWRGDTRERDTVRNLAMAWGEGGGGGGRGGGAVG
jgi:glucokinase